jgi:hypothetical protein
MTDTTLRAAGSSAPFSGLLRGPAYSMDEQLGSSIRGAVSRDAALLRELHGIVMLHADTFARSCYNRAFPGVFLNGVREMHRRSSFSSIDAEPFVSRLRSGS